MWGFDENTVYLSPAPLYHSAPIGFCCAAQALGGSFFGTAFGAIGDVGAFSLQHYKVVTSGEGGLLVTSDGEIADRARRFSDNSSTGSPSRAGGGPGAADELTR